MSRQKSDSVPVVTSLAASRLLLQPLSLRSIVVKMATGSGWQQYYCPAGQGKFSSSSASSVSCQSGIAMEYTQDLHLKMSKKIAQLTKVRSVTMGPILTLPQRCTNPWYRFYTYRSRVKTEHQTPSSILRILQILSCC